MSKTTWWVSSIDPSVTFLARVNFAHVRCYQRSWRMCEGVNFSWSWPINSRQRESWSQSSPVSDLPDVDGSYSIRSSITEAQKVFEIKVLNPPGCFFPEYPGLLQGLRLYLCSYSCSLLLTFSLCCVRLPPKMTLMSILITRRQFQKGLSNLSLVHSWTRRIIRRKELLWNSRGMVVILHLNHSFMGSWKKVALKNTCWHVITATTKPIRTILFLKILAVTSLQPIPSLTKSVLQFLFLRLLKLWPNSIS